MQVFITPTKTDLVKRRQQTLLQMNGALASSACAILTKNSQEKYTERKGVS